MNRFIGFIIMLGFAIMAMPFVGAYKLVYGEDEGEKTLGKIFLVVGTVIYVLAALQ